MVWFLIVGFPHNICDYDYYIIHLLYGNYMSLHCSMLSTRCIKATVPSIRYFNWQKIGLLFCPINWQHMLLGLLFCFLSLQCYYSIRTAFQWIFVK